MSADFSSLTPLANHLWQSTFFVGVVWLVTLGLKRNRAAVRYWLWFAASVKFFIPFSLVVALGGELSWRTSAPIAQPQWSFVVDNAIQPFAVSTAATQAVSPHISFALTPILIVLWLGGVAVGLAFWLKCWRQMGRVRKTATALSLGLPIPALSSTSQIEPGVFGIFRPVLLLPEGIKSRLTPAQLDAIVAHEMTHVRRRDNLTAAIHMVVETVFWFFPLVYWLRARLIEERENACDESVLRMGSEAESYAEGIIEVCKLYAESPAACISGISGSDLKKRVIRIVNRHLGENLTCGKKVALALASVAVVIAPLVMGFVTVPLLPAQSAQAQAPSYEVASIKIDPNGAPGRPLTWDETPDGLMVTNVMLELLIRQAYGIQSYQIERAPEWVNQLEYDISARIDDAETRHLRTLTKEQATAERRLMLQALLADRFQLAVHHETKEAPVYALVVAKNGPKFHAATPPALPHMPISMGGGLLTFEGAPMSTLARLIAQVIGRPALDRTGLTGNYAFTLKWTPDEFDLPANPQQSDETSAEPAGISIFTVIQDQLGLKLESTKGPVDFLVIDHIEKPSPN